ncbi:peptidoglycan-associated lipoprotein Pal [Blochmannia endosymbiont of Camponotus (Colobopsis) obliquus]|uniref:peptidoglycan-associated lipoprotein Pal n=1 Tax=Blochmannia endosymbiont of Camponotus (Colobopsis) obliquus TaxID=1505597 RepID=UPI00061A7593|nr:peptidoglycan-associated lipoprotein Pal [Blochmannia endosymbiont of Camponotus (Colobopsis) obliquus]AKC60503.1 peptidoglycan-associated lipoprotein [Blochmannia endosymbiont of Camponotus (Colobopsis) obliquus]
MQLIKVCNRWTIIALIILNTSCGFNKKTINDNYTKHNANYDNFSSEQIDLKIQELQNSNTIYFDLNKYNIIYKFIEILDSHVAFLLNNPSCKIIIEGHADERGTPEYNIALGERRANAVKMYLESKGVCNHQITIVSYGKEKPAVLGHTEEIYARNRRAVLIYI